MKPEHLFPVLLMIQYAGAAIVYRSVGNSWNAAYWLFALGLTFVVTFKP